MRTEIYNLSAPLLDASNQQQIIDKENGSKTEESRRPLRADSNTAEQNPESASAAGELGSQDPFLSNDLEEQNPDQDQAIHQARLRQQQMMRQLQMMQMMSSVEPEQFNAGKTLWLFLLVPKARFKDIELLTSTRLAPEKEAVSQKIDDAQEYNIGRYEQLEESQIDLECNKTKRRLDYGKVVEYVRRHSAHRDDGKPYSWTEACCKLDLGYHCLGDSSARSELEKYGVGVVLYFKFVKTLVLYFFIFSLLSIPALLFSITAYQNFNSDQSFSINRCLLASTIGSLGLGTYRSQRAQSNF